MFQIPNITHLGPNFHYLSSKPSHNNVHFTFFLPPKRIFKNIYPRIGVPSLSCPHPGIHHMVTETIVCSPPMVTGTLGSTSGRLAPPSLSWARRRIWRRHQAPTQTRSERSKFLRCFDKHLYTFCVSGHQPQARLSSLAPQASHLGHGAKVSHNHLVTHY